MSIFRPEGQPLRVLITGGCGFVGSTLTPRLVREGYEVTVTAAGGEPIPAGVARVLYSGLEGIDWRYVGGQDAVVHLMANNDTLCADESEMYRANVYGPIKLFTEAARGGCQRFVFASSTAVYGDQPAPYDEESATLRPLNRYAESKAKFEEFALRFATETRCVINVLRFCNVYGPGEERKGRRMSMVGQILRTVMAGGTPRLFHDGSQKRDWLYVEDAAEVLWLAMTRFDPNQTGNIYNAGSGTATSFNDLVRLCGEICGRNDVPIEYVDCPFASAYQAHTECKIEKAREKLGPFVRHNLRSGLEKYHAWLIAAASDAPWQQ